MYGSSRSSTLTDVLVLQGETALAKGIVGEDFFEDRVVLVADPGLRNGLAGAIMRNFTIFTFVRVTGRDFYRQTGRDHVQHAGMASRAQQGGTVGAGTCGPRAR